MVIPMELCKGSLMDEFKNGPLSQEKLLHYLRGLAAGFLYLHQEKHIVHRDVKADNMLIGQDGLIRLGDLGLATVAEGEAGEGESKGMMSTNGMTTLKVGRGHVVYRSPESLKRGVAVGYGDDMWAVGLMLAEMVTGRTMVQRMKGEYMRPACKDKKFMQGVILDVATKVGVDSLVFKLFVCLICLEPKLRMSAHGLHEWLRLGTKPDFVILNEAFIKQVAELLLKKRVSAAVVTPPAPPGALSCAENSGETLLAALNRARLAEFAEALAAEGYEELEDIMGVEFMDSELTKMGMKGGHMRRFRKLIQGAYK
jgi:serine/threonine protein kinase